MGGVARVTARQARKGRYLQVDSLGLSASSLFCARVDKIGGCVGVPGMRRLSKS